MLNPHLDILPEALQPLLQQNWEKLSAALDQVKSTPTSFIDDLTRVLTGSNFVTEQLERNPEMLSDLLDSGNLYTEYAPNFYQESLQSILAPLETEEQLHKAVRCFRQREQVRLIWRDLTRASDMRTTTRELSWLADACVEQVMDWLYVPACERWGTPTGRHSKKPLRMVVLGMGKLGANELNLSSDIDLIFVYPENGETEGCKKCLENQEFFIRLGKKLIQALDNLTFDGFVFRVDMRLRPFGSAGPLAISFDAMEGYYQEHGREWERYAMIKARVMAGDKDAGDELMSILRPFVYRKYIDFSAFDSLREMKDMISREVRRKGLNNNVKLGSGGIREVEFIAQVFQLLRGGRDSRLQQRELCKILPMLPDAVGMPQVASDELMQAYEFLRNAEHAIQAVADKQTQELPNTEIEQLRLAFSMGFSKWDDFSSALENQRNNVRTHFADLIAQSEEETSNEESSNQETWLSLWKDELEDEQAEAILKEQGFDTPKEAWELINNLRQSKMVQMLQQIAQERLRLVLPNMFSEIIETENPTETLGRVLELIQAILRRSAYLVLLAENPMALQQLVKLCSASAWFSEKLTKQPILLDELIDQKTLYAPPNKEQLNSELRQQLLRIPEEDTEQIMDALRYFKNAHVLKVAASEITGALPLMKVSDYLTWTAEVILEAVVDVAWRLMTEKHGSPQKTAGVPCNPDFIVLGYGKVGGIELSYGSDLDLVFIHDSDPNLFTDGDKQIANSVFFTRLGQKIIHILNTFTTSGQLYEVDMRLRPSGNSGLLVSSLKAFREYQKKEAWTWEHQALVRARVVAGDTNLKKGYEAVRAEILENERDTEKLLKDVSEMREKMRQHLGSKSSSTEDNPVFHLKHDRGGIVDIEFLVQFLVLNHAHQFPELYEYTDNIRILNAAEKVELLNSSEAETLREAYKAYRAVGHKQTMKDLSNTISASEMTDLREAVAAIWHKFIGD
ncbi:MULTISPECIES: bifunctional [glutamate--ammonia ligase]-adenylyl-L-tyrosine phosphorylase/[glutamate--ammonia-ligase] adenylyltransferase [unclassified Neptuniibacter]|uniref:bifunctional [glutamate--ammonia ligase]-adenylyl-L-tyrosine phosphorylase/[glutamate--ammonia-ligase] adenylyltransferase n=1 Tax=unclassified Neptuniibacter TaxID=2630693 RepID=UPI000C41C522|nr:MULTISPECIES: bifunctional [glutamate--ammonia ligase]-adenylyl-L-tyrosine phosphorylase/[glutamate--ammonia-ligase] adenylyltransferase [unclassified Neptuniibacter]MAY43128.1 bifunctional [glutamate--ammonia ligase]-adenylyl-L-tyrosine phosphorylase/[glutamate--ammonia-ligase] adenylyltransferase [Oceanospirillaceae bacterium]|tara:strand:- start:14507 stop:17404 length:2898 start_codon:yes stop_codon:yes gene_type:complete